MGQVQVMFPGLTASIAYIRSGKAMLVVFGTSVDFIRTVPFLRAQPAGCVPPGPE